MPVKSLLKPEIKTWLLKSIESELFAHLLYSQIANELQRLGYFGSEKFFRKESSDEFTHYSVIADYMNDMGDVAKIPSLTPVNVSIQNIGDALYKAYQTELDLMRQYQDFFDDAKDADSVTAQFLLQFLEIQRKSVGEFGDFIARYEKNPSDVFEFDEFISEK